jgi:hypothetical protein
MGAMTRWFFVLLKARSEIAIDEVDEKAIYLIIV